MWKPFMNDGILYASCPDCKYDVTLEIAKKLESCPICAKLRAGVDRSYWISLIHLKMFMFVLFVRKNR